ncbi:MAG: hypothetical protein HQL11_01825 [Candidatus Omnitrophica bacterium]|nr:hypothetical protein [Candidatus Omnitrophota bacterium]
MNLSGKTVCVLGAIFMAVAGAGSRGYADADRPIRVALEIQAGGAQESDLIRKTLTDNLTDREDVELVESEPDVKVNVMGAFIRDTGNLPTGYVLAVMEQDVVSAVKLCAHASIPPESCAELVKIFPDGVSRLRNFALKTGPEDTLEEMLKGYAGEFEAGTLADYRLIRAEAMRDASLGEPGEDDASATESAEDQNTQEEAAEEHGTKNT